MKGVGTESSPLEKRLQAMLESSRSRSEHRIQSRMMEMQEKEKLLQVFDQVAQRCVKEVALPRFEMLVRTLGNGSRPEVREKCDAVSVTFRSSPQFPVGADVSLILAHDPRIENILALWKVSIIPILVDYEREGTAIVRLDAPDFGRFAAFLDDRVVRFVSDYLTIHEPDSPYLQIARVTDPVCGMTIPRTEAAACADYDGKTYYFCIDPCRDLFTQDAARYLRSAAGRTQV